MTNIIIKIAALAFFYGFVVYCQHPQLLSKLNQCGNWNVLADIDCTASPRLNVQYTLEMHSLQKRIIKNGMSPETHYHLLATNVSYATAINLSYGMFDTSEELKQLRTTAPRKLPGEADATSASAFWTNIPSGQNPYSKRLTTYDAEMNTADFATVGGNVHYSHSSPTTVPSIAPTRITVTASSISQYPVSRTGWYQYTASIGMSSATYLELGLNTAIDYGLSITYWMNCGCARYSWGNDAHTLVNDVYGQPLIYLEASSASPSTAPPSKATTAAPTKSPSRAPSRTPTASPSKSVAPTTTAAPSTISQYPVSVTGWYMYPASIGMSAARFLPLGLDTPIDNGLTFLQWINCGCARYSWGNSAHTSVNDVYDNPLVYLVATVPSSLPTRRPSNPSKTPTLVPTSNTPTVLSYNLKYHGGKINPRAVVQLIFWGPSWVSRPGDKISGLELFYRGWSGSGYANTVVEYSGSNGQVTNAISYGGYVIDSRTPSPSAIDTGTILNEVCAMIPNPDPSGNGYYVVYTELPRGSAGYCGWHSAGYCKGIRVQFGFIFNLDNDYGCTDGSPPSNPGWEMSQGMHALASVTAHELAEVITDPGAGDGWLDSDGLDIGDKCAWTFPPTDTVFSNGIAWRIQGEWSNAAAIDKRGYPTTLDGSTVYGCIGSSN